MFDPSMAPVTTILSLIFVAVSFLISHYMDDHDRYVGRLSRFQYYCKLYKTSNKPCDYINSRVNHKNDEQIIDDCNWFRVALIDFGPISLTLMVCFLIAIFIATYLMIEIIPYCEPSLRNTNLLVLLILFMVNLMLLFQLWLYSRQGDQIAHWINELKKIGFDTCCEKYLKKKVMLLRKSGVWATNMRLWLARVDYKYYPNLYPNSLFLILIIIWALYIIFSCFCG